MARLFSLPLRGEAHSGDPWQDEHPESSSWPIHVFDARTGSIALDIILRRAGETASPAELNDVTRACSFFSDPAQHCWDDGRAAALRARFAVPSSACPGVARSRLQNIHLDVLAENAIVDFLVAPFSPVSVFAFLVAEPPKTRQRVIFDTLMANAFVEDAEQTTWRATRDLLAFFFRHTLFASYDFRAYYFQFKWSDAVAGKYVGRVGNRLFRILRCPMGHKNSVKSAHTVTAFVAQLAITLAEVSSVEADVIIDNVCFGGADPIELAKVQTKFEELCAEFHIIIGDRSPIGSTVTHRGLVYDASSHLLRLKNSFRDKFIDRIRTVCNEKCTFERARSLLGSINYARIYFARRLPETFYFWKATARWAQSPKKDFCLSPAVITPDCIESIHRDRPGSRSVHHTCVRSYA